MCLWILQRTYDDIIPQPARLFYRYHYVSKKKQMENETKFLSMVKRQRKEELRHLPDIIPLIIRYECDATEHLRICRQVYVK